MTVLIVVAAVLAIELALLPAALEQRRAQRWNGWLMGRNGKGRI